MLSLQYLHPEVQRPHPSEETRSRVELLLSRFEALKLHM